MALVKLNTIYKSNMGSKSRRVNRAKFAAAVASE